MHTRSGGTPSRSEARPATTSQRPSPFLPAKSPMGERRLVTSSYGYTGMLEASCQTQSVRHVFVSGNVALDFVGTLKWRRDRPEELLESPDDLRDWVAQAHLVDFAPRVSPAELQRALDLREAIYTLATDATKGRRGAPAARQLVNAEADGRPVQRELTARGISSRGDVAAVLATIAQEAVVVLGHASVVPIKECANPPCTRLFVDRSPAGGRRWCGMSECGGRAKVAAFRQRQRAREPDAEN